MPCYHPLKGWRSKTTNPTGKRSIVFTLSEAYSDLKVELPCGQCIGCRLERSKQWAVRCMNEASEHKENSFLTLTYDDKHLPPDGSLKVEDFQNFMKRLRFSLESKKVRFFHCGEYGDKFGRPHYHALLFGHDFNDKQHWTTVRGEKYFVSEELKKLWPHGHSIIGNVTFKSAAYVARYITKKITGPMADWYYNEYDGNGDLIRSLKPEYVTMSRRPGIGKAFFEKYKHEIYPDDFIVIDGKKYKAPKAYDAHYEVAYPSDFQKLKARRKKDAARHIDNSTPDRLEVREYIQYLKLEKLKRSFEK